MAAGITGTIGNGVAHFPLKARIAGTMENGGRTTDPVLQHRLYVLLLAKPRGQIGDRARHRQDALSKIFASPYPAPELTIIWHAGEPLVVPPAFYSGKPSTPSRLCVPASLNVRHAFQTNGMLLTPEWCDLFKHYRVSVGVSIDGPKHLHDAHRVTRSGRGTFDRTMAGIRLLQRENVPFHVITVLSKEHLENPGMLIDFYAEAGIANVCFNVEESEGNHTSSLFTVSDLQSLYAGFLERFLEYGAGQRKIPLHSRDRQSTTANFPAERSRHAQRPG